MAELPRIYDLMLLLSTTAEDEERTRILTEVETAIVTGGGELDRNSNWGRRPMTFEIRHQPDAEYHLLQFSGPPSLLESLNHSLRITDGVLRFRIIKVLPGTPPAPDSAPPVIGTTVPGERPERGDRGDRGDRGERSERYERDPSAE
jgi:small subunit ribosomal protein S6